MATSSNIVQRSGQPEGARLDAGRGMFFCKERRELPAEETSKPIARKLCEDFRAILRLKPPKL